MTRTAARHLVFVAAAATVADRPERMRAELDRGVYALFHLLKAAATGGGLDRLDIVAPTVRPVTGGERQLAPQHATLFGLAKAFAQEHGGCAVRCVDDDGDTAAVCAELRRASTTSVVALRDGARWVQVLAPADARDRENAKPADLTEDARNYLITGGLGGLGLAVAEHLSAQRPTARIALVGRSPAPAPEDWATLAAADAPAANTAAVGDRLPDVLGKRRRQARTLDAMRERGTDVRTFAADVADEAAMREIVTRITAEWGALDCVVHAAGVAGDGFLFRKDAETFAATVAPKVLGAAVLDSVTDGDVPPRIITFGSTVTVFGAAGQGGYTAANDYLAAFADARSARGRPTATLAWSDWLEVGMAVDNAVAEHQGFFRSLTLAEALSSFDLLAGGREPNTIIGEINTAKLGAVPPDDLNEQFRHAPVLLGEHVREVLARARRAASGTPAQDAPNETVAAPDVVLLGRDDGDYTPTERMLAGMWASELGLDRFDITASSFMLGGDSLAALRMATRIEKVMNISVSVIDIFQYETAAELAVFLDSQLPGADGPA
jgi:NAD(P)-dependent dehydrogenase (short-subunit alcohol dehydrogenase family)/acyl carrier protein